MPSALDTAGCVYRFYTYFICNTIIMKATNSVAVFPKKQLDRGHPQQRVPFHL